MARPDFPPQAASRALESLRPTIQEQVDAEVAHYFPVGAAADAISYRNQRYALLQAATQSMLADVDSETFSGRYGEVVSVALFLSDFHDHGRSVTRIDFSNGRSYLHKPRVTSLSIGLAQLMRFLHAHGIARFVAVPEQLQRDRHVWSRALRECTGVATDEALGQLMAVAWLLGSVDLHSENVWWDSGTLYLIDEETMLHPALRSADSSTTRDLQIAPFPRWSPLAAGLVTFGAPEHVARRGHVNDLDGFSAAFETTLSLLANLLATGALGRVLQGFARQRVRVVLRPTHQYFQLLALPRTHTWAEGMASALDEPVFGRRLPRAIRDAEYRALQRGDIPLFSSSADGRFVRADSHTANLPLEVSMTAFERMQAATIALQRPQAAAALVAHVRLVLGTGGA